MSHNLYIIDFKQLAICPWKTGVPASLTYVDLNDSTESPALIPYPSWEANKLPEHKINAETGDDHQDVPLSIISTFRLKADECDRLWVVDTGSVDLRGNETQYLPPALLIFDLKTDQLIRRYIFKDSDKNERSFFANIAVDATKMSCNKAFAYVPDLLGYGVVIYSYADNDSWRVRHNYFSFDPVAGNFDVAGINFQWSSGVFTLAVGPVGPDGSKDVYFHSFASTKEFRVSNTVLQNESYVTSSSAYHDFQLLGDRGPDMQSSSEAFDDETKVLFYALPNQDAVGCWNVKKPYIPDTQGIIDKNNITLVFSNDLIVKDGYVWVLSDRLPVFLYRGLNPEDYNYRILKGRTLDSVAGTPCANN